jgi:hypothetical protein
MDSGDGDIVPSLYDECATAQITGKGRAYSFWLLLPAYSLYSPLPQPWQEYPGV